MKREKHYMHLLPASSAARAALSFAPSKLRQRSQLYTQQGSFWSPICRPGQGFIGGFDANEIQVLTLMPAPNPEAKPP
jgi:hypothetical protein